MHLCTLTDKAKAQLVRLCNDNNVWAISLNLKGGGCAGFEYEWGTVYSEHETQKGDYIIDAGDNAKLCISAQSLMFLVGTEIDYVESIVGSNFEIKNPNAQSSCGCGVSVNFDMDKVESNVDSAKLAHRA
jgi:iron-sulfur cluster assembly accessory protein